MLTRGNQESFLLSRFGSSRCHSRLSTNVLQSSREDDGDVFLGEANALGYIQEEPKSVAEASLTPLQRTRFRYAVPKGVKADDLMPPWELQRRQKRINHLSK